MESGKFLREVSLRDDAPPENLMLDSRIDFLPSPRMRGKLGDSRLY